MLNHIQVIDFDLDCPPIDIEGLNGYTDLKVLARLHGAPIGYVQLPVINGCCTVATVCKAILGEHRWAIMRHLLVDMLVSPQATELVVAELAHVPHPAHEGPWPLVTVAVCTRDRTDDLAICLNSLNELDYPALDLLVVDNAPANDKTERLVRTGYPKVRYVREPRPGLDWARNRAIAQARGEIVAYTDDDVVVDPGWVTALVRAFEQDPEVMAVTGLVAPYEFETVAQVLFEMYGGFGRGFQRKLFRLRQDKSSRSFALGTGECGTGANMAYRRSVFEQIGPFDPALDVGTVTNGGGDLEMFYRVQKEGYTLVYEPSAIIRHRHRREYAQLRAQLTNNGIGLVSYWVRTALAYPDERPAIWRIATWWLRRWSLRRLLVSLCRPSRFPRDLIWAECTGFFIGLPRYLKARRAAAQIAEQYGPAAPTALPSRHAPEQTILPPQERIAVRVIDLEALPQALTDVQDYAQVRVYVRRNGQPIGSLHVDNNGRSITRLDLAQAVVDHLGLDLLKPTPESSADLLWSKAVEALTLRYAPPQGEPEDTTPARMPSDVPVSIVVATLDRPDDLRECITRLVAQETARPVEIVIVDNHPASGLTPPVVAEFPGVVLVNEPRRGLAYARNAGFVASSGDIALTTDDDVCMPVDWLEKMVAPFARSDVMVVTGNTLPAELETRAQRLFEAYGGLGRGLKPREADGEWFESYWRRAVPTWTLGATANAAFRTAIFCHPEVGLMDEALGPGMPSGVGEDTYLFYKVLKAGHRIHYQPDAYVWHKHRREMRSLRRQIHNYSKGHVAYNLTTWLCHGDLRGLSRILVELPLFYVRNIAQRVRGKSDYPLSLLLLGMWGNLHGFAALWRSRWRVRKEGKSPPYVPPQKRTATQQNLSGAKALEMIDETRPHVVTETL